MCPRDGLLPTRSPLTRYANFGWLTCQQLAACPLRNSKLEMSDSWRWANGRTTCGDIRRASTDGHMPPLTQVGVRMLVRRPKPPEPPPEDPNAYVRGGPVPDWHGLTRFVAVDPGRKYPVKAVVARGAMLHDINQAVRRQGEHQAGPFPRQPPLRPDGVPDPQPLLLHFETLQWSASRYYEQAGHKHRTRTMRRWLLQEPQIHVRSTCPLHTPSLASMQCLGRVFWKSERPC